jgi:hypothetical protein
MSTSVRQNRKDIDNFECRLKEVEINTAYCQRKHVDVIREQYLSAAGSVNKARSQVQSPAYTASPVRSRETVRTVIQLNSFQAVFILIVGAVLGAAFYQLAC